MPQRVLDPKHHPHELSTELIKVIVLYRQTYGRCAEVLHHMLTRDGYKLSLSSVKRTLKRQGLVRHSKWKKWHQYPPRPLPEKPGLLVQVDTIFDGPTNDRLYIYTMLDVCSRWAYARPIQSINTHASWRFVRQAKKIMPFTLTTLQSDHGQEFSKWFTKQCTAHGLQHRHSRVRRSTDNAHLERFNRTLQEECLYQVPKTMPIMKNIKNNRRKKIRIAVLFGGKSAEHEISILSARNIVQVLDTNKYDIRLIGIDKNGAWLPVYLHQLVTKDRLVLEDKSISGNAIVPYNNHGTFLSQNKDEESVDVVFPILHGPMGEDGAMQGLLKLANVPFVGAGVLGSAVGMDKDIMKRLLRDSGIPIAKFLVFRDHEQKDINFQLVEKDLGLPFFVKPANLGSSVGISKVKNKAEFKEAIKKAFSYDRKILIEENVSGREIECSVLGNDKPRASVPGEVLPNHEFYSYEAKYLDENGATLKIPAKLSKKLIKKIQDLAVKSFKSLNCDGMARVDFFVKTDGEIYVNEINTIPGFTAISMYPKLWKASGISYAKLVDTLIQLAIERFKKEEKLLTSRK